MAVFPGHLSSGHDLNDGFAYDAVDAKREPLSNYIDVSFENTEHSEGAKLTDINDDRKAESKDGEKPLLQESCPSVAMATKEGCFKKGHSRKDSGHVMVTQAKSSECGDFSPTESSDEEKEPQVKVQRSKGNGVNSDQADNVYVEKSDDECNEKCAHALFLPEDNWTDEVSKQKHEFSYEFHGNEKIEIRAVALDMNKLAIEETPGEATVLNINAHKGADDCNIKADKQSKSVESNSKNVERPPGSSLFKDCSDKTRHKNGTTYPKEDLVDFTDAIRDKFADIVHSDLEVMPICDYLYQYRIMNGPTYEEFLLFSHPQHSFHSQQNLKRKLLLFMSKRLPRHKIADAVTNAGYLHVFIDVLKSAWCRE